MIDLVKKLNQDDLFLSSSNLQEDNKRKETTVLAENFVNVFSSVLTILSSSLKPENFDEIMKAFK